MSCKESFEKWMENKSKRSLLKYKKKITDSDRRQFYAIWQLAWVYGRRELSEEIRELNEKLMKPMPDEEMKQIWIKCGLGKDFGRAVEMWHGIK